MVRQDERGDYARAARALADAGVDVVLVQHEYGIFGGDSGEYLLDLTSALTVPYVVTLHTLLQEPSARQAAVLGALVAGAAQVTVFTAAARDTLVRSGVAPWGRVSVVHHGAPAELQARPTSGATPRRTCGRRSRLRPGACPSSAPPGRRVLSTFGLLSSVKGIEVALRAMATVARAHPDVLYVVAGRTHPHVVRTEGERYRESLEALTRTLGLDQHVLFVDRYLSSEDIRGLLGRTEVFLTPYRAQEQVVSGVLTFAIAAGCPVVSTPYRYATELLSTGAGRLVGVDDPDAMATALLELLGNERALRSAARAAHALGTQYTWPAVGREVLKLVARAAEVHENDGGGAPATGMNGGSAPSLDHLDRLVDGGGIVQHARGLEPDRSTGYCVDDAARLLIVADGLATRHVERARLAPMAERALTFLEEAWEPDAGQMRNFRAANGEWLDAPHPGDHLGRAVWALGEVGSGSSPLARRGRALLDAVVRAGPSLAPPRTAAFAVLGLARLPGHHPGPARGMLRELADDLGRRYRAHRRPDWPWFEDELTYDNARLPQALIAAAGSLRDADLLADGLESLEWYAHQCGLDGDAVVLVGNRWRRRRDGPGEGPPVEGDEGDEQPVDAAALVEACVEAYRATGSLTWARRALDAFGWFEGRNRWGAVVYDEETGGCHDGVGPSGLNENEGAESTLAHLQARLALDVVGLSPRRPRT